MFWQVAVDILHVGEELRSSLSIILLTVSVDLSAREQSNDTLEATVPAPTVTLQAGFVCDGMTTEERITRD